MRWFHSWMLVTVCCCPGGLRAQLQLLPAEKPQSIFAGMARNVTTTWRNDGTETASVDLRACVFQTSSSTAAHSSDTSGRRLEVPAGETVIENVVLQFPAVRAKTGFLVQWMEGTNRLLGNTRVVIYPTNLLAELKTLMDGNILGVLDPNNTLKPLLKQNGVKFVDLEEASLEEFRGKLALIGPFQSPGRMRADLASTMVTMVEKGVALVWFQPPSDWDDELRPSYCVIPHGKVALVVVQPELIAGLSEIPRPQLNLVYFCKQALSPNPVSPLGLSQSP